MFFHGSKLESLHEHISPSNLPEDFGGTLPAISYSAADWYPVLRGIEGQIQGKFTLQVGTVKVGIAEVQPTYLQVISANQIEEGSIGVDSVYTFNVGTYIYLPIVKKYRRFKISTLITHYQVLTYLTYHYFNTYYFIYFFRMESVQDFQKLKKRPSSLNKKIKIAATSAVQATSFTNIQIVPNIVIRPTGKEGKGSKTKYSSSQNECLPHVRTTGRFQVKNCETHL